MQTNNQTLTNDQKDESNQVEGIGAVQWFDTLSALLGVMLVIAGLVHFFSHGFQKLQYGRSQFEFVWHWPEALNAVVIVLAGLCYWALSQVIVAMAKRYLKS